jgi:hypothetical protein
MEPVLLSTTETMLALGGISRTSLFEEAKAGRLRPVKIGRRALYPADDVRAYVDALKAQRDGAA